MSKTYREWNPGQSWLLPPSPRDWLPEDDAVYFVLDTTAELDLSAITAKYEREQRGFPPFHPRMMATLLLYSYTQGVFSSRRIMKRCARDAAWRVIVQDDVPDFRTISDFRKLHLAELQGLFVQVLRLCQKAGLVKLGHVALDGTKIKANASRHKAMSYGRMKEEERRLGQEIRELLSRAEATDAAEDRQHGPHRRGDELPAELARRESRLKRIQEARAALEAEAQAAAEEERRRRAAEEKRRGDAPRRGPQPAPPRDVPDERAQYNFTDPETKIMKASNKGFDQCGNAQAVVDGAAQIIVAADVTNEANDRRQFQPMLTQARENVGRAQRHVGHEPRHVGRAQRHVGRAQRHVGREPRHVGRAQRHVGREPRHVGREPRHVGREPRHVGREPRIDKASADAGYFSEANAIWAEQNQLDAHLATGRLKHHERVAPAPRGRPPADLSIKERMARKLRTKKGRATYAQRKAIVEPVFGFIKRGLGFTQFLLNGLAKMRGEWRLVCMACNLRKLYTAAA